MLQSVISTQERELLDKLQAIRKAKADGHDDNGTAKDAAERALERIAKRKADAQGITFAKAYDATLQTPEGGQLYAAITGRANFTSEAEFVAEVRKLGR